MNWKLWRHFTCWLPLMAVEDDAGGSVDDGTPDLDATVEGGEPAGELAAPSGAATDMAADMADAIRGALAPKKPDEAAAAPPQDGTAPKGEEKPGAKPEKPGETKPPAKREDRYAVPQDAGPRGQARFKELVGELKTKDEEITRYKGQVEVAQQFIADAQSVGVGAQEFNAFFEYMGALKRGDGAAAMRFLQSEMAQITKEFGVPRGPEDTSLLERFPDLKDAVDAYKITPEHALELAQARIGADRNKRASDAQAEQERHAAEQKQVEDTAIDEVARWFSKTAGEDIDFVRKKPLLLEQLPELVQGVPPRLWMAKVKSAYALLGKVSAPGPREPAKPRPTPLRPGAGGGQPESTSMLDAIRTGLMNQAGRNTG